MTTQSTPEKPEGAVIVRLTHDHKSGSYWFEEQLLNGQWAPIQSTRRKCEGNTRHALKQELERRRQNHLAIMRTHSEPETHSYL